ncbi:defective in Cullin neddylation protein 1 [Desarmillaria tabescens]|uniref:Defective in cullin neddylation protein n=1 Tax=Armillaria tabescens TaxID=1929756 RepID=A0AA39KBX4_ARMTA|nr:defective in Cullin neddylation protein 1 [Desarmillaria tabescens]KAK0457016.1 defective in Cullin neddylation protein 1 [Desarmillaria tabescens]
MSDETTAQFCSVTGAQAKDAKRYLDKYKRLDAAVDAYYNDPVSRRSGGSVTAASTSKLNALFDKYKDPDGDEITIDGTIKFCEDLSVNPEDVVLLSVAYELKSKRMAMDSAQAFWALLLPHGLKGGALSHTTSTDEDDVDMDATSEEGWKDQYTQWWFEYLEAKGGKGVSKDTWSMFLDFVRSIDAKFEKYDAEGESLAVHH